MYALLLIAFTITILFGLSVKNRSGQALSKSLSDSVKGYLSLMIVCNHLAASVGNPIVLEPIFRNIGFICVSVFFFISGWGTMDGYLRNEDYLVGFVVKKVKKILVPYMFAIIMYSVAELATGADLGECIESFFTGTPVAKYSWYVIAVFVYYIEFWFSFRQELLNPWIVVWSLHAINLLFCILVGWPMNWINTSHAFIIGALLCQNKDNLIHIEKKKIKCSALGLILLATLIFTSYIKNQFEMLVLYWIGSTAVCVLTALVSTKVEVQGNAWKKIASISFELYLYHGLTNSILKRMGIIYQSNYVYCIVAYICAILMAYVMHRVDLHVVNVMSRKN